MTVLYIYLNLISLDNEARRHKVSYQMTEKFREQHTSYFHESTILLFPGIST